MNNPSDRVNCTLICLGMCFIWYTLSIVVGALPHFQTLQQQGLVMPVLCLLEFAVLVPLWRLFCRHYDLIPLGQLRLRPSLGFVVLLGALILSQSLYLQQESWTAGQFNDSARQLIVFSLAVVLLAPIFEEIVFRGFLLQSLLIWAPRQRFACALLTSLGFAAMHTQYHHLQTAIALTLLSLMLCYARLVSRGLKLPIMLHMLNNAIGVAPWLWTALNQ